MIRPREVRTSQNSQFLLAKDKHISILYTFPSKIHRKEKQKKKYKLRWNISKLVQQLLRIQQLLLLLQTFYGSPDFVWDNPGELVPEETFTHSHPSQSTIIPYCFLHLTIHGIIPVQFMCLAVFLHNLCQSFLWSTKLSSFHSTCPYHHNLFSCSTKIMSSNPIQRLQ